MALQPWHPIVAPNSSMSFLVILSLWIRAPSNGNGGIGMGSTRTSGLSPLFSVCHPPRHSNHIVDGFFVPPILRFQSPNFSGSEHAICIPNEALCAVVSHSKPNPILFLGSVVTRLASTISPNGTNSCGGFLPCILSNGVFPSRPF